MALGNQSNKIYLSISDGKVVLRVPEGTAGAEPRTKKDGTIVWEQRFSFISGILKSISIKESSYAGQDMKDWILDIEDGSEAYTLQLMYDSRYATSLLNALCNPQVDFGKPITINPWMKVVNDKKKTACYLKQDGENIDWYFTKDNPNGLPPLRSVMIKGKETWDNFDQMQFFESFINANVKPKITANSMQRGDYAPEYAPETPPEDLFADDLPF